MGLGEYNLEFDKRLCELIQQIKIAKGSEKEDLVRQALNRLKQINKERE